MHRTNGEDSPVDRSSAAEADRPAQGDGSRQSGARPTMAQLGLTTAQAAQRLVEIGPNALPRPKPPSIVAVFLRQFLSPLIYILLAAAAVSLALGEPRDALFIAVVLLINGVVGTAQEHSADKAAAALSKMEQPDATVIRDGAQQRIEARSVVPGDIVLLEAGGRVPADLELVEASDLQCDESLLTGESLPVRKRAMHECADDEAHNRLCRAYAGTVVNRGRGRGVVVATGAASEFGRIARELNRKSVSRPPLLIRLERFSRLIALAVGVAVALLVAVGLLRGMPLSELFMMSVGLAVSAIPEGLPWRSRWRWPSACGGWQRPTSSCARCPLWNRWARAR
ncbi:putative cation-transporting ATPase F [compost metagenome]